MFENIINFFKNLVKKEKSKESSDTAKERLHLVLMQDRANVSADFLELMKQEIIEVIKKYIDVDEKEIDVHLTNKPNEDGTVGAPALYANIPIVTIKNEARKVNASKQETANESENIEEEKSNNEETQQEVKEENAQPNSETVEELAKTDNTEPDPKKEENTEENKGEENKEPKIEENIITSNN